MASHIQDQEELENFKYFWKSWGRWLFTALLIAALAYLGYVLYQNYQAGKDQEAAGVLAGLVEKAQNLLFTPPITNTKVKNRTIRLLT